VAKQVDRASDAVHDDRDILELALDRIRAFVTAGATTAPIAGVHGETLGECRQHWRPTAYDGTGIDAQLDAATCCAKMRPSPETLGSSSTTMAGASTTCSSVKSRDCDARDHT
jgi:hypothetical protein